MNGSLRFFLDFYQSYQIFRSDFLYFRAAEGSMRDHIQVFKFLRERIFFDLERVRSFTGLRNWARRNKTIRKQQKTTPDHTIIGI